MEKGKLTKREYLGEGYYHIFSNVEETKRIPITKEEYLNWTFGSVVIPTLEGYFYKLSVGGTIDVDTPSKELSLGEFTIKDDIYYVMNERGYTDNITEEEFNSKYIWQ